MSNTRPSLGSGGSGESGSRERGRWIAAKRGARPWHDGPACARLQEQTAYLPAPHHRTLWLLWGAIRVAFLPGGPLLAQTRPAGEPADTTVPSFGQPAPDRPEGRPTTVFEQFKQFVQETPPSGEVLFSYQGPDISYFDEVRKKWAKLPAPTVFIRARWRPRALAVLTMPTLALAEAADLSRPFDLHDGAMIVEDGRDVWTFQPGFLRAIYWRGTPAPAIIPINSLNPVVIDFERETEPLFALFAAGPHFVPPRAVRRDGNRFQYV